MSFFNSIAKIVTLSIMLISLGLFQSCGKGSGQNQYVSDIYLETKTIDGDSWIYLKSVLNIGGLSLPSLALPIVDPRNPGEQFGEVSMIPVLGGQSNEISIGVNLSKAANLPTQAGISLPNGQGLPLRVPAGVDLMQLTVGQTNSKIYLGLGNDTAFMGFAVAIKEFDQIARYLPGANIFMGFNIKGVLGSAGIFTSDVSGQSGIGLFVDLGTLLKFPRQEVYGVQSFAKSSSSGQSISFVTNKMSNKTATSVYKGMKAIRSKQVHLSVD